MKSTSQSNVKLHKAKKEKNDEFYTRLVDIENELRHHEQHFKDKIVYCNCDDPTVSKFFHYFSHRFESLGLKKLITTCYKNQERDLFSQNKSNKAIYLEYTGDKNDNRNPDKEEIEVNHLDGDGDFRSKECIELLKQADIVVTNPPFSLFREYVAQLMNYDKKFLIIGNMNAITYKDIFKFIKENRLWLGYQPRYTMLFDVPKEYAAELVATKKEGSGYIIMDGSVMGSSSSVWFTNLEHSKRHEDLVLYHKYDPEKYPTYDNYDAINVDKVKEIPKDYSGVIGVPISFLDKYNPEQFEILGVDYNIKEGLLPELVKAHWKGKLDRGYINGKRLYSRVIIKKKQ